MAGDDLTGVLGMVDGGGIEEEEGVGGAGEQLSAGC